jgi:hypothetical protein
MRTRTFDAIVTLLADGEWHTPDELATETRYPERWIEELSRESLVEVEAQHGQVRVRLRVEAAA